MANGVHFITDAELITGIVTSHLAARQKKDLIDFAVDMTEEERHELMELIEESNKQKINHTKQKFVALTKLIVTLVVLASAILYGLSYFDLI